MFSKTLVARFDHSMYSVHAKMAGRPMETHAYAGRIVVRQHGEVVGEHVGRFGGDKTIYDPGAMCRGWCASPAF